MRRAGRVTPYMLVWVSILLLFSGGVWFVVEHAPVGAIKPNEFTSKATTQQGSSGTIDETLSATDIQTKDATWTVNGDSGKITLIAHVDEGLKRRGSYGISNGKLTFLLRSRQTGKDKETLVLRIANATYSKEQGVVKVQGTLYGTISEGGHSFLAKEMKWDQAQDLVETAEISYSGPGVAVSGKQMSIDLNTGVVRFDGPVDVGI
jgi:hypothetical protein